MANVYKIMDTTGDGRLSWKEIKAGFEQMDLHYPGKEDDSKKDEDEAE